MKIQELIGTLLAGSTRLGTFTLPELIKFAQSKSTNGIAVAVRDDREFDLAILDGEPEGAILIEEKGTLYGDKAVMLLTGTEIVRTLRCETGPCRKRWSWGAGSSRKAISARAAWT